jgi:putative transposase
MSATVYYPTDLTAEQWTLLGALLPERKGRPGGPGRPPCDLRAVLNGLLSLNKSGCQWRLIPQEFGHWNTI